MFIELLLFQEQLVWNTQLLAGLICVIVIYAILLKRFAKLKSYLQPLLFFLGLGLLYFIVGSPLSNIIHLSFSLHMIQMSILYFIIPPIILLGIPQPVFYLLSKNLPIKNIKIFIFSPKMILYIFAILFTIYHLPFVLSILSDNSSLQNGYLLLLFLLSFGMWWPIASPDPKQRLCKKSMKRYAFLSGIILMPACSLFILTALIDGGDNPFLTQMTAHLCLPTQSSSFNILPPPFNTRYDQFMAGIFMLALHKLGLVITIKLENKVLILR